jgi:gliding motility-associated-like protein
MKIKQAGTFLSCFFILLLSAGKISATHNRAGEITYEWIGQNPTDYKYRATIITFTKTSSVQADRPTLDSVHWGDGTPPVVFQRSSKIDLGNNISKNIYVNTHTYAGNGSFLIHFTDPNRNADVVNIPHSVSVPFYLESLLIINPFLGQNSSPIMTYEPIDQGCINRVFIHNPGAHDPDPNDSLSYELVECRGDNGSLIGGYFYPQASVSFSLDPVTGDLVWDSPILVGEYNVAFKIHQWRNGFNIGYILRDMQILINNCDNYPPKIYVISDTCVLANETLTFNVTAIDGGTDRNNVVLSASGGILDSFIVPDPATFTPIIANNDTVVSRFNWNVKCSHVRQQPYYVLFKAEDRPSGTSPPLVDLKGTFIRVIAPPPPAVFATANGSAIDLHWTPSACGGVVHFSIYRRNGLYNDTIQCPCENGVPSYTGYTLIGTTDGTDTTFTDDNSGQGLTIGIEYCYLVTAVYSDSSESCASPQVCASLKKDAPVITHADVRITDQVNGSVFVGWSKPTELDTLVFTAPYEYRIYRSPGFSGSSFIQVGATAGINDTMFIDTLFDTQTQPWSYKIELYYTNGGTLTYKGQTAVASTVYLTIAPTDNRLHLSWEENVPWTNARYDIFKQNSSLLFDSIASVNSPFFSDTGLVNGNQYCYYIRSSGSYAFNGFIDPIINRSQIQCAIPVDNVHPCSPDLSVNSFCDDDMNQLVWTNPNNICADDVLKYYIYFGASETGGYELIDSTLSPLDTFYFHTGLSRLSGCYKVTAVDSVGNETITPETVCVDTCRQYVLPSAFTPNGDGKNDFYHPCDSTTTQELQQKNCPPYKNVESVDMKIYNRWGNLVFETNDKDIRWDGKNKDSKADCSEGVYFYTCKVYFYTVNEEKPVELKGTIQLLRE